MRAFRVLGLALTLGACATGVPSYVALSSDSDATIVADDVAAFVADQMPAGAAKIAVYVAPGGNDTFAPKLMAALQAQDMTIESGSGATAPGVHQLRYQIDRLGQGELVRIELDGRTAAQLLTRDGAGSLEPSGPFTLRAEVAAR